MLFAHKIKSGFALGGLRKKELELGRLFFYLEDLVADKNLLHFAEGPLGDLKRRGYPEGERSVSVYLLLEKIIIGNIPPRIKQEYTREGLRDDIKAKFKTERFGKELSFLFLPAREQSLILNESFLSETASYILHNLGGQVFAKLIAASRSADLPESIAALESGFSFDAFDALVRTHSAEFGENRRNKIFEELHLILYGEISRIFGTSTASALFYKIYSHFQSLYGFETASVLLDVLPKELFSSPEWVSLLSKGQLEERLMERARKLEELNRLLEQKVGERTADLSEAVANLRRANAELKTKTELLVKREAALQSANLKLRELDQKKSEFMSIVAHQLRTPLSGLKWTLGMLIKGELGELKNEQKVFLMKSYESNERMVNLVNDMLTADRIELGKSKFIFTATDILDVIDNVLFEMMPQAAKRGIKLSIVPRASDIPKAPVDQEKIRAVFQNLLDNAIKYSKSGSEVAVSVTAERGFLKVAVADHGIGIPEDQQEAIFSKFFRARNALKMETDGSGLGLFIVKSIIEKHGGRIWFESEENKGTTFYFTLKI